MKMTVIDGFSLKEQFSFLFNVKIRLDIVPFPIIHYTHLIMDSLV